MSKKQNAILMGPFVGELYWECGRFAPMLPNFKKIYKNKDVVYIVLTREDRFDLYGKYADILIPLRIKNEEIFRQREFGLTGYNVEYYDTVKKYFYEKYNKRFDIVDHFCPLTNGWKRKIKWQLPRDKMSYDFQAKEKTYSLVNEIVRDDDVIVDNEAVGYIQMRKFREINATDLFKDIDIGVVIEALKACEYVIGNMEFEISHLAVLLHKPLISLNEKLSDDSVHLLNPMRTPIIRCRNILEGVEIYENNFRPEKSGTRESRRVLHFNKIR